MLGNIPRYTVNAGGSTLTVDVLNRDRSSWCGIGSRVALHIPADSLMALER